MLVKSQNKKMLIPIQKFVFAVTIDNKIIASRNLYMKPSQSCESVIGVYSTTEKAIKVLDMIANTYTDTLWTDTNMIIANRVVFEMPQDNEVEV